MDLLKKVELLLNAKTRSALPRRGRSSPLDEQEREILAEIRAALRDVETKERQLAERLKMELHEARDAADRGDYTEQRVHKRRATELEQKLDEESILAIDLEEKLVALEQKLTLAREAVEQEARKVVRRDAEADQVLAQADAPEDVAGEVADPPEAKPEPARDEANLAARKARLSR
jgi:hypothetical protein